MSDKGWITLLEEDLEQLVELTASAKGEPQPKVRLRAGARRQVTALFLDIRGFTALSERFDHERVAALLDRLFTVFRHLVERRGGSIENIEGDALLAVFGSQVAHEDDAVRALDAGLAILESFQSLESQLQRQEIELGIRIGIHSGEVTRSRRAGHEVITGDTANTAARLEQNAEVGTILVSDVTRRLAGQRFEYDAHPDVHAKGKAEPIPAWVVVGRAPRRYRWERTELVRRSPFVGRRRELEILLTLHGRCRRPMGAGDAPAPPSRSRHVLVGIRGEAGVGKSRLVRELLQELEEGGVRPGCLEGSVEPFAPRPFDMLASLLANVLGLPRGSPELRDRLEELLSELGAHGEEGPELGKALPMLGSLLGLGYQDPRLEHLEPEARRVEIQIAFRTFVEALAARAHAQTDGPLILILDDVHWLDEPSRQALVHLLCNARTRLPLLVLATYRPEGELPDLPSRRVRRRVIELEPLSRGDDSSLIQGMLGSIDIPADLLRTIEDRGAGNPFYLEELVHHLVDTGTIVPEGGGWRFTGSAEAVDVPGTLRNLILARIDQLQGETRKALQHASVLGREFLTETLAWIEDRLVDRVDPEASLQELELLSFVVSTLRTTGAGYLFKHILTRDVAYETLLRSNRRVLHRLCAEAIEEVHAEDLAAHGLDLAEHWLAAGEHVKAGEWFVQAGEAAREAHDHPWAVRTLSRALDLLPDAHDGRIGAFRERGKTLHQQGRVEEARQEFEQSLALARDRQKPEDEGWALYWLGMVHLGHSQYPEALEIFGGALEVPGRERGTELEANLLHGIGSVHLNQHHLQEALERFQKSHALFRRNADLAGQALTICDSGHALFHLGRYQDALERYEQALESFLAIGDRMGETLALASLGNLLNRMGRQEEGLIYSLRSLEIDREIGDRNGEAVSLYNLGKILLRLGRVEEATQRLEDALEIFREIHHGRGEAATSNVLGRLCLDGGRLAEAEAQWRRSLELLKRLELVAMEIHPLEGLGRLRLLQGRPGDALEPWGRRLEICRGLGDRREEARTLLLLGHARILAGEGGLAREHYRRAEELALTLELGALAGLARSLRHPLATDRG